MITNVRVCLSYDCLKLEVVYNLKRKHNVVTDRFVALGQ